MRLIHFGADTTCTLTKFLDKLYEASWWLRFVLPRGVFERFCVRVLQAEIDLVYPTVAAIPTEEHTYDPDADYYRPVKRSSGYV